MKTIQDVVDPIAARIKENRGQPGLHTYITSVKMTDLAGFDYQPLIYGQIEIESFEALVQRAIVGLLRQEFNPAAVSIDPKVKIGRDQFATIEIPYTWL